MRRARRAFYEKTLGLRLVSGDQFAIVFDANGTMLRVTPVHKIAIGGYTVLGWNVADIEASLTELAGNGVQFEKFPGLPQAENATQYMGPHERARHGLTESVRASPVRPT